MSDPATLAWYQANAHRYGWVADQDHSDRLDRFLDRLEAGANVLELGCGAGQDSAHMTARGFAVDPTDASPAMVALARERFGLDARPMRFDQLASADRYDGIWANACLLHVPQAELPSILVRVRRALRPEGWHFASYKLGEGEARDPLGRLTNFPQAGWLDEIYRAAGFAIVDALLMRGKGADGVMRDWYALTVQRRP